MKKSQIFPFVSLSLSFSDYSFF